MSRHLNLNSGWICRLFGVLALVHAAVCLSDLRYFFLEDGPLHRVHLNYLVESTRSGLSLHMLSVGPVWILGLFALQLLAGWRLVKGIDCRRSAFILYVLILSATNRAPFLFGAASHYLAWSCLACAVLWQPPQARQSDWASRLTATLWMSQVSWASFRGLTLAGNLGWPSAHALELVILEAVLWGAAVYRGQTGLRIGGSCFCLAVSVLMFSSLAPLNPSRIAFSVVLVAMRASIWLLEQPDDQAELDRHLVLPVGYLVLCFGSFAATYATTPNLVQNSKVADGTVTVVARELPMAFGLIQDWIPSSEPDTLICLWTRSGGNTGEEEPVVESSWQQLLHSEHRSILPKSGTDEFKRAYLQYLIRQFQLYRHDETLESVRVVTPDRQITYFKWQAVKPETFPSQSSQGER